MREIFTFGMAGFGRFSDRHGVGPARFPLFDLFFVHQGRISLTIAGEHTITVEPNQGVILFPDTPFRGHHLTRDNWVSVQHFGVTNDVIQLPRLLEDCLGMTNGFLQVRSMNAEQFTADVERIIALAHAPAAPADASVMRQGLFTLVLAQLQPLSRDTGGRGQNVALIAGLGQWLADHIDNPPTLAQMAAHVGLCESHLRARFKQEMGISPGQYMQRLRMDHACKLLRETMLPIKKVAGEVGYNELPNFHRSFRRMMDQTPANYRRKNRLRG